MFAYHKVPPNLRGDYLMPLNELKHEFPDVYANQVKKYEGRESLCRRRVPPLNCEWSDLIMFTLCHPATVIAEYTATGKTWRHLGPWFRVDPLTLDQSKLIVFLNRHAFEGQDSIPEDEFVPYSDRLDPSLAEFTESTRKYYQTLDRPLIYRFMPHLLYRGRIPLHKLQLIEVGDTAIAI